MTKKEKKIHIAMSSESKQITKMAKRVIRKSSKTGQCLSWESLVETVVRKLKTATTTKQEEACSASTHEVVVNYLEKIRTTRFELNEKDQVIAYRSSSKKKRGRSPAESMTPTSVSTDDEDDDDEGEKIGGKKNNLNYNDKVVLPPDQPTTKKARKNNNTMMPASVANLGDPIDVSTVETWREQHKIVVMAATDDETQTKLVANDNQYFPYRTFESCRTVLRSGIHPALIDHCVTVNQFLKPSPIQAQSWPIMIAKRDIVGIAETGSGKTLAFALPILSALATNPVGGPSKEEKPSTTKKQHQQHRSSPRMLTLSPTRELAMQSDAVLQEFGKVVGIGSLVVYGGVPKHTQVKALQSGGVDCIVATPGRLKDLIADGACDLRACQYLVLDEADRMLDMGFEEDVKHIISFLPTERQTVMFSATWPAAIQSIALTYMKDPVRIYVGFEALTNDAGKSGIDDSLSANKRVTQSVEVIEDRQRESRLRQILEKVHNKRNRVLIFALYKKEAERLEMTLKRQGWNVCSIHGNKNQGARTEALQHFKDGTCPLLVATDVAARGLDIPNVEVVINYTFPLTIEDYVHRIGRTGRAGKTGQSYTFFQPTDKVHAGALQQVMRQAGHEPPEELMKFGSTIKKKEHKLYGNFGPRDGQSMKKATKIVFD